MDDFVDVQERENRALVRNHDLGAPSSPVYVDGSRSFEESVAAYEVVLVHYYATRGAGQRLHPTVEAVARETSAAVAKVNVVHHQKLTVERDVRETPTFDLYATGAFEERIEGAVEKERLVASVEEYTGN